MALVPKERELAEEMRTKPFVLLDINADETRDEMRAAEKRQEMTWRSWWDGPNAPISARWNITSWPTIYIVDRKGVIRCQPRSVTKLHDVVETLVNAP
jgi:hypothetical protein